MKKSDVKIGGVYSAKITDEIVPVRIERTNPKGGWDATNLKSKRTVRIKSAMKLRGEVASPQDAPTAATSAPSAAGDTGAATKATAPKAKRTGILDAAAQILAKAEEPMNCKAIVEQAIAKNLWSTRGKTPHATLYAAIIREIASKGQDARFEKVDRGRFRVRKQAAKA